MKKMSKMQQRINERKAARAPLGQGSGRHTFGATPMPPVERGEAIDVEATPGIKRVYFMGRQAVGNWRFGPEDVLISISDTRVPPPALVHKPKDMLAIAFHDEVTTQEESELGYRWMSREQSEAVAQFVLKHTEARNIIVHCNYGQSRSKAVAVAIKDYTGRRTAHLDHMGHLVAYRDKNDYGNRRVYELTSMAFLEQGADMVAPA